MRRIAQALTLLVAGGCVPLTPYAEIEQRLPDDRLIEVGGRQAHVVVEGAGEPLVLLHGFGAAGYSWRHVAAGLAPAYRTIAIDLNGFGYTERPRGAEAYTVSGQLDLVLGVMDELGVGSAHLAGHSYGGALALHLAWRHPERVRSLVLVDSAGVTYPWSRRTPVASLAPLTSLYVRARAIRRGSIRAGLERSFADDGQVTDELVDAYFERVRVEGVGRAFRGLTAPTSEPRRLPELERLDLPVLMVWGSEDTLTPPAAGRAAAQRLPRAEFHLIDGVGHIPLEESPGEVAALMRDFLDRQRPWPGAVTGSRAAGGRAAG